MERFEGPGEERAEGATDALRDRLDETEPVAVVVGAGFRVGLAIGPTVAGGGSDTAASVGTAGVRTSRAAKARANHVPPTTVATRSEQATAAPENRRTRTVNPRPSPRAAGSTLGPGAGPPSRPRPVETRSRRGARRAYRPVCGCHPARRGRLGHPICAAAW